jgi:hypothetical protein
LILPTAGRFNVSVNHRPVNRCAFAQQRSGRRLLRRSASCRLARWPPESSDHPSPRVPFMKRTILKLA